MNTDPRVDAYIERSAEFARPILSHLRACLLAACPEAEETIKWGMPFFVYRGRPLANMAAFKQHCAFGFWRGKALAEAARNDEAMGQFGRITALGDLPPKRRLMALARQAVALADAGPIAPRPVKPRPPKPPPAVPADLAAAFLRAPVARRGYESLAPSRQREYVEWLDESKRTETRAKRLAQAIEWLAEGKSRNWKYERR